MENVSLPIGCSTIRDDGDDSDDSDTDAERGRVYMQMFESYVTDAESDGEMGY